MELQSGLIKGRKKAGLWDFRDGGGQRFDVGVVAADLWGRATVDPETRTQCGADLREEAVPLRESKMGTNLFL